MSDSPSLRAHVVARVGALTVDVAIEATAGALVVVGPNGAGKTTLLSCLLGVTPVERGRVQAGGRVLLDTEAGVDVPVERRGLGYVPQDYALLPHLTVRGNVAFAVDSAPARSSADERRALVDRALQALGVAGLAERLPGTLSGGERQRVALARALSVSPRALLLDEPLAALDVHARRQVRSLLAETLSRLALPTVVVTHDAEDARVLGEGSVAVLEAGRITQAGTWSELTAAPATAFVRELAGASVATPVEAP